MRTETLRAAKPMVMAARQILADGNDNFGLAAKLLREARLEVLAATLGELSDEHYGQVTRVVAPEFESKTSNWEVEQTLAAVSTWSEIDADFRAELGWLL